MFSLRLRGLFFFRLVENLSMQDHILSWAEEDRPREKLLLKGSRMLSDAELIAILLGSGSPKQSALSLARSILSKSKNNLHNLARTPFHQLCEINGVGKAKAVTLLAAFELGRRKKESDLPPRRKISGSVDVYNEFQSLMSDLPHEEFWILLLNRANIIIEKRQVSSGGFSGTVADPKMIFGIALGSKASSIILVHNHPSGNTSPSEADIQLTRRLRKAGEYLTLPVLDHLIVTASSYYSFADEGSLD